jgi:hypothetical protein
MAPEQKAQHFLRHRRRPPTIALTSGFPILRYRGQKEKSRYVSRLLEDKIRLRSWMTEKRQYMEGEGQVLAAGEDIWDKQLARFGIESGEDRKIPSWAECHDLHSRIVNYHQYMFVIYTESHINRMRSIIEKWNEKRKGHIYAYLREKRRRARQRRLERERVGIVSSTARTTLREKWRRQEARRKAREEEQRPSLQELAAFRVL